MKGKISFVNFYRFPPIQLLKSEKKASDIEKKLNINAAHILVDFLL